MEMSRDEPQNAIGYVRLSELRRIDLDDDGNGKGNVDQRQRIADRALARGWRIVHWIVENDLSPGKTGNRNASAFKRRRIRLPDGRVEMRTVRPGFRKALSLLVSGKADGFMALDLDRTVRDPRDLEDMIDVVEQHKMPVDSVTGSLRLGSDADITMARVMVAVANKESRDKARRVAAARQRQAIAGEYGGGRRPFGFDEDGITVRPDEAEVIKDCTIKVVQGSTLRSLALELRDGDVPTVTGARWSAETLRDILLRPRNAGRIVYQGEEIGDAPWDPIVPVEVFRALQSKLKDPDRRTGPGAAPKWLGSNLFTCGICTPADFSTRVGVQVRIGGRQPAYRCSEHNHLVRAVKHVNAYVEEIILGRLEREDAVDLLPVQTGPEVDAKALYAEAKAIRKNLNELAEEKALGLIDRAQLIAGTEKGKARLDEITSVLQAATVDSPLAELIGSDDVIATWEGLSLSHKRLVVDLLVTVRILPSGRKGRGFDPATVDVRWKPQTPPGRSARRRPRRKAA